MIPMVGAYFPLHRPTFCLRRGQTRSSFPWSLCRTLLQHGLRVLVGGLMRGDHVDADDDDDDDDDNDSNSNTLKLKQF